ncbi:hypothetical protein NUU61_008620 [Penicillium alfredii]|uniref:Aminotransferase class V domain-containing protein n=1 Tax=Penicillium alfredii TaxID=1506179 RepID=A0A9W9ELT3_9EURO|nr:uncharacterized protein NUU61_008620 [Penicillium alfredii]KAJ5084041.1 hypothetical protein NUU61_008620 [Penicillium alfredii]
MQRHFLDVADAQPDPYVRQKHAVYLEQSREAVAKVLNASKDECVFVKNATTGVSTVLHNLAFQPGEVLIYFEAVYGAVEKGIVSLQEHSSLQARKVDFQYPITEDELARRFREVVRHTRNVEGLTVRAAVFDAIVSNPGVRFPFERVTALCKDEGILSVIDGAHGIGHVPLDMGALQPDFFVSNCHKYDILSPVDIYFIRTTLPTSWGFIPAPTSPETRPSIFQDPNQPQEKTPFEELFEFVATSDDSAYLCVPAALKFRAEVCGGERAVMAYCQKVANEGADAVAAILGTEVMQEPGLKPGETSRMRQCSMTTVRLPIAVGSSSGSASAAAGISPEDVPKLGPWLQRAMIEEYHTFVPVFPYSGSLWVRLSGQTVSLRPSLLAWSILMHK